jgi:hypothetical protein
MCLMSPHIESRLANSGKRGIGVSREGPPRHSRARVHRMLAK